MSKFRVSQARGIGAYVVKLRTIGFRQRRRFTSIKSAEAWIEATSERLEAGGAIGLSIFRSYGRAGRKKVWNV